MLVDLVDASSQSRAIVEGCTLRVMGAPDGSVVFSNDDGIWRLRAK